MLVPEKKISIILSILASFAVISSLKAQTTVAMKEANKHIGENLSVCGTILSIKNLENVKDKPTLINLANGIEHLDVILTNGNTSFAGLSADSLLYKDVCVTGKIVYFTGTENAYLKAEYVKVNHPEVIAATPFTEKETTAISLPVVSESDKTSLRKKIELNKSKPDLQKKALLMKYMKMGHIVSFSETANKKTYIIQLNRPKKF